jgi:hypothetical protein
MHKPLKIVYIILIIAIPVIGMTGLWEFMDSDSLHQMILFVGLSASMALLAFVAMWLVKE